MAKRSFSSSTTTTAANKRPKLLLQPSVRIPSDDCMSLIQAYTGHDFLQPVKTAVEWMANEPDQSLHPDMPVICSGIGIFPTEFMPADVFESCILAAVANGHTRVLEDLIKKLYHRFADWFNEKYELLFGMVDKHGQVQILECLRTCATSHDKLFNADVLEIAIDSYMLWGGEFISALTHGHLELAKWIFRETPGELQLGTEIPIATTKVVKNGYVQCLKWLLKQFPDDIDVAECANHTTACHAAKNGHLDMLRWMVEESGMIIDVCDDNNNSIAGWAAHEGQLHILKWLVTAQAIDLWGGSYMQTPLETAARIGQLHIVRWILDCSKQEIDKKRMKLAVCEAIRRGHVKIVKYMLTRPEHGIDLSTGCGYAISQVASDNHLEVLKWLVLESGQKIDLTHNQNEAARKAAKNGHLDLLKWLVNESGQDVRLDSYRNYAIAKALEYYEWDVVKWMIKDSNQVVDISEYDKNIVRDAVRCKVYKEQVEWLMWETGQDLKWLFQEGGYL